MESLPIKTATGLDFHTQNTEVKWKRIVEFMLDQTERACG